MLKWNQLNFFDTKLFSDSTEISPNGKYSINCCYQLNESTGVRQGSFSLINIENDKCEIVTEMKNTDGILDCCWINEDSLVLAGASGRLYLYSCSNNLFNYIKTIEVDDNSICLSVDSFRDKILCTTSKGNIAVYDKETESNIIFHDKVHEYEAWVGHLSRHHENIVYCGGDDCIFNAIDLRCDEKKIFSKRFEMGVTSIASCPKDENLVSMGSYDGHLRVWDVRNMQQVISDINVGGGVWRHKWCPQGYPLVLVAAMHAGFVIVNTEASNAFQQPFEIHKYGLGYGADWIRCGQYYIITLCSFYDHRWSLSKLETVNAV